MDILADPVVRERARRCRVWFDELRDRLVAAFEALEDAAISAELAGATPQRIVSRPPRLVNIIV